ncbi:MAG: hypothetical protein C0631_12740 [Sedimenticola sp.]|nr:MAG: hypothetical protein C0631_12740 [Sedimenticola sp.]
MVELSSNQRSFIALMAKSREHARRGFEILLKRPDCIDYFDPLADAGLFHPSQNPAPVPAEEPGYVQIPFWDALNYLEAVARESGETNDLALADKPMTVVRAVSQFRETDGAVRDNYHTWRTFADILGLVPTSAVTLKDLELIAVWLGSRYDRGLVASALDKGILKKLLASEVPDDWDKACAIVRYCTAIQWVDEEGFGEKRQKPVTIVDDYWLKKLIENHAGSLGKRIGRGTADVFLERLCEVYSGGGRRIPSWLHRPAVEEHQQNHSWDGPYNRFVEGLRDALLAWVDHDQLTAQPFIQELFSDHEEIARRVAVFVLNQRWEALQGLYSTVLGPQLFDSDHIHELYGLLKDRFHEFTDEQKGATVEAIRQIPQPSTKDDAERRLRRTQRNWLSAIAGRGYEPAETWFQTLNAEHGLGSLQDYPDFHSYSESWSGPGPSPFSVNELITFATDGTIVEQVNTFQQTDSWRGPTRRALVDTLEEAVVRDYEVFLDLLPHFLHADRPYQYGIINGFKRLWDAPEREQVPVDWEQTWNRLVEFFESLTGDAEFWAESVAEDRDLTPTRDWIPPVIAETLRSGTRKDEKAYPEKLLPRTWAIIGHLLDNLEQESEADEDAMHQAINSSKGKAIEALFSHALRECRISDRTSGEHNIVWDLMRPTFDRELAKCTGGNYEFSTLIASYIANIDYMSHDWLQGSVKHIFPDQYVDNFMCALEGLAYAPATRPIYALLLEHGVLDRALHLDLKGRHSREKLIERIALAYLWGDEELDAPRLTFLFGLDREADLVASGTFFWSVHNQDLTDDQVERILCFWEKCIDWSASLSKVPVKLLSSLSRLSCYISSVSDRERNLLLAVAPYVNIDYNAVEFIDQLDRLADDYPAEISVVLKAVLDSHRPISDYQDRLKSLLIKLNASGLHAEALDHAERLRYLPGIQELFEQLGAGA